MVPKKYEGGYESILHRKVFSSFTSKLQLDDVGRAGFELNFCFSAGRRLRFELICTRLASDEVKWFSKLFLRPPSTRILGNVRNWKIKL